jgi:hypothetical protein
MTKPKPKKEITFTHLAKNLDSNNLEGCSLID